MEANNSFLIRERVAQIVNTSVATHYLATVPESRSQYVSKVEALRGEVSASCIVAAGTVERVIAQLGDCADRIVLSRSGGVSFIFLAGSKYAMIECDEEGTRIALLSDRASEVEAETWIIESGELTATVRRIRSFLGAPNGSHP